MLSENNFGVNAFLVRYEQISATSKFMEILETSYIQVFP